jgi:CRP-like cAMP-binding protein
MVGAPIHVTSALFKEIKLFQSFSERELDRLISLGTSVQYESHTNIVIEGELSWGLYIILEGLLGVFKTNKLTGQSYDVGQLRTSNFFGEMSLVDDNPRSATVKTLTQCQLFYISKDAFTNFLDSSKDIKLNFYQNCVKTIVNRLRELDDNYVISQYQLWQTVIKKEGGSV